MELPPAASPSAPMLRRGPLTFADDGQSGAVNDEVQAGARAGAPKREGEMLTAARARGVIGGREIDAQHPDDRCQEALGLTQRSVEDETERQGGFDGEIGILELPAPPADASRCPLGREPEGDVASPHEGSVVLGPVPDAILCLVLRMHSRLHIEIMTRRRSRWSTCRPLLAHRAESAHQRPTVVVPPTSTAHVSRHGPRSSARDRTILAVKERGRRRWMKTSGYHGQARVENAFFRYKSIIGDSLRACSPAGRGTEVDLACNILNQMTGLGRPMSYRIGR